MKKLSHIILPLFTAALFILSSIHVFAQEAPEQNPAPAAGDSHGADTSTIGNDMYEADYFTGAATKRIELTLPPGRAGIVPQLVLNYNSHRRDPSSQVGFGWDFNSGYIERGASGGLNYSGEDFVYVANGQRTQLVSLSNVIVNGCQEFRAKVDDANAVRYFKCSGGWRVYDKDGVAHAFGSNSASRIENSHSTEIFRWYLDRVTDLNGNFYVVNYISETNQNLNHSLRIDHILYTGHPQDGNTPFRISFAYNNGGYEIDSPAHYATNAGKLLHSVEIFDGTKLIRKYELEYKFGVGGMPLLKALRSKGYDGAQTVELPTQEFDYSDLTIPAKMWGDTMARSVSVGGDASLYDEEHSYFDINGDGYLDRIVGRPGEDRFDAYYGSYVGFFQSPDIWEDKWVVEGLAGKIVGNWGELHHTYIKDMNGDGLPDRLYGSKDFGGWGDGFLVFLNNGGQWMYSTFMSDPLCPTDPAGSNINCGKISDAAGLEDVNGDGLPDRIIWHNRKLYVYYNRGHSFVSSVDEWDDPSTPWPGGGYATFLKDMNGDGLVDRVERGSYDDFGSTVFGFKIYMSYGGGWYSSDQYFLQDPDQSAQAQMNEYADFIDLNRDGLPDRVIVKPGENRIYIYWNQGRRFSQATVVDDPVGANAGRASYGNLPGFMDMNGDGYLDRVGKYAGSPEIRYSQFRPTYGSGLYLLGRINNGLGVTSGIQYREAAVFLNRLLPMPLHVVTNVILEEGEERKEKEIKYAGGYFYPDHYNPLGRRFNGFHYVEIRDSLGNIDQRWYKQALDLVIVGDRFIVPDHTPTGDFSIPIEGLNGRNDWELPNEPWDDVEQSGRLYHEVKYFNPNDGTGLGKLSTLDQRWELAIANGGKSKYVYLAEQNVSECIESSCRTRRKTWEYYADQFNFNLKEMRDLGEPSVDVPVITKYNDYFTVNVPDVGALVTAKPVVVELWDENSIKNKTALTYDAKGNVLIQAQTLIDGSAQRDLATTYTHDIAGNVLTKTDPLGRITTLSYDATYRTYPATESMRVNGLLFETRREFDGRFGKPTLVVTPDGRDTIYTYDPFGRVKEKKFNGRWQERYEYVDKLPRPNSSGLYLSSVRKFTNIDSDPTSSSRPREVIYRDGQGRLVQTSMRSERASGEYRTQYTAYQQSAIVNRRMISQPAFMASEAFVGNFPAPYTMVDMDSAGRVFKTTPAVGEANSPTAPMLTKYGENGDPWTAVYTDEIGSIKKETRDSRGRIVRMTEVLNGGVQNIARYSYDFWGNRTETLDSSNRRSSAVFDNLGRKTRENDVDRGAWLYRYDDVGNLLEQTDARGAVTTFQYDELNRIKRKTVVGANVATESSTFTYDTNPSGSSNRVRKGELGEINDNHGFTRLSYNEWGGIERVERTIAGLSGVALTQYDRDSDGRVLEMKYPGDKLHLKYDYDRAGQANKVTRINTTNEELYRIDSDTAYDAKGHLLKSTYGNGVAEGYAYYPGSQRLREVIDDKPALSGSTREKLRHLAYKYNASGDALAIEDKVNTYAETDNASLQNITYDSLHRITGYSYYQGAGAGATNETYTYDNFGNLITNSDSFGSDAYTYNVANHAHALGSIGSEQFSYDSNGNMTQSRGSSTGSGHSRTLTYGGSNNLAQVEMANGSKVGYSYGGLGERLSKQVTKTDASGQSSGSAITYFLGNYLEIQDGPSTGSGRGALIHNVYVGNKLIAQIGEGRWGDGVSKVGDWERNRTLASNTVYYPSFALIGFAVVLPLARRRGRFSFHRGHSTEGGVSPIGRRVPFKSPLPFVRGWGRYSFPPPRWGRVREGVCESLSSLGLDTSRKVIAAVLIVALLTPATALGYVFPSDVPDSWPADDGSYFVYVHLDHLHSSNLFTEGKAKTQHNGIRYIKGEVVQRVEYTPFGKERYILNPGLRSGASTGAGISPKFTDQVYDVEDGLYFYQSRYYDAVIGRFIQPDSAPIELLTAIGGAQGLNRYAYVLNNPLKYVDPSGSFVDPVDKKDRDRSGEIDKLYNEVMQGTERTKQKLDEGAKELGGTVGMEREMRFEYEDASVNDLARAGRGLVGHGKNPGVSVAGLQSYQDKMLSGTMFTAGVFTVGVGIVKVVAGIIVIAAVSEEAASLIGIALVPHTISLGLMLISAGVGTIGAGGYFIIESFDENKIQRK